MRYRFLTLLLLGCLMTTVSVQASSAPVPEPSFSRIRSYQETIFPDVAQDSVFYDNVAALYEYGLTEGKADGTYGLQDSITVGQAVIFAARIRSLYETGDPETGPSAFRDGSSALVAAPYLSYLQNRSVISREWDSSLTQPATRAQVAHLLARSLPEGSLSPIHADLVTQARASRQFIPDVTEYTPYYEDILLLYRAGISIGNDAVGSFAPDTPITRGAAAALLTRILDPSLRMTPGWDIPPSWSVRGTTYSDLVPTGDYVSSPSTEAELHASILSMLAEESHTLSFQYALPVTSEFVSSLMHQAVVLIKTYTEQSYNYVSCSYTTNGHITLTFSAAGAQDFTQPYRQEALAAAITLHDTMWENGSITTDMTETERALVYYRWICENCEYDRGADDSSLSHIPYSLFARSRAVCDGYTGAYNLLLKLEGISCTSVFTPTHIWTQAVLDGTVVHIDTTWGDMGPQANPAFFAMTPEEAWSHHPQT